MKTLKELNSLVGTEVTAVGNCGQAKNRQVIGILGFDTDMQYWFVKDGHRIYSINENTVKSAETKNNS